MSSNRVWVPRLHVVGAQGGSGCEDLDFFERLVRAGHNGYYVPELAIYHQIPRTA